MAIPRIQPPFRPRLTWVVATILVFTLVAAGGLLSSCSFPLVPTPTPTAVPTAIPPTATSTETLAPTATPSPSPEPSATPTPDVSPTPSVTPTPSPTPGQLVLGQFDGDRYGWSASALIRPHGLALLGGTAYTIDAGQLVAIPLEAGKAAARLVPPDNRIGGIPVGEMIRAEVAPDGQGLIVLDKRGDFYRYDPASGQWSMERPVDQRRSVLNPAPASLVAYAGRTYLLDVSYSQVWRYPYGEDVPEGYLPGGNDPTTRWGTQFDLTRGVDLGMDGNLYVLLHESEEEPARLVRYSGESPKRDKNFGADLALENPVQMSVEATGTTPLAVIDHGGQRLQLIDRESGSVVQTFANQGGTMRAAAFADGRLYVLATDGLYVYPGTGQAVEVVGMTGPDPAERPDDPQKLDSIPPMTVPIQGLAFLPGRDSVLPGAPRIYRYGIHQGIDMYDGTMGVAIPYGTPVHAAAAGTVIRADLDYRELTPEQWDELAARCDQLHNTPPEIEDVFSGRQVWIDHGNGVVTHYVHLSGIEEGIVTGTQVAAGQLIGKVGNSGTSDGAAGTEEGPHLHFEIYVNGRFLGEGLTFWEVRQVLQRLLFP